MPFANRQCRGGMPFLGISAANRRARVEARREAPRVLIVDDSHSVLFMLRRTLEQMDFRVDTVDSLDAALTILGRHEYRAVITDLRLGGDERTLGLEVLSACKRLRPERPVIVLTGFGNPTVMEKAFRLGATFYFEKPVSLERLRLALAGEARP
jgi:DNA-binding NtrC family response regulator